MLLNIHSLKDRGIIYVLNLATFKNFLLHSDLILHIFLLVLLSIQQVNYPPFLPSDTPVH